MIDWLSNILFNTKASKAWDPKLFYYQFLPVLPNVTATYLGVLLPAELVRGLESHWDFRMLLIYILILSFCICLLNIADRGMQEYLYRNYPTLVMYYEKNCYRKIMNLNYGMLEDPSVSGLIGNTWNVLRNEFGFRNALCAVPKILSGMAGILWYGSLIAQKSFLILILTVVNALFAGLFMALLRKKHQRLHEKVGTYSRKTSYINRQAMDKQAGKDIRMYQMTGWFLKKYDRALSDMDSIFRQIHNGYFLRSAGDAALTLLTNGFTYFYLISLLIKGEMTASAFVLYIGLAGSLFNYSSLLMNELLVLNPVCVSVTYIRQFLALPESPGWSEKGIGKERMEKLKEQGVQVELKNVSYSYPGAAKAVLSHLHLTISPGEKLALIGLNGAGKTTLVKLLCGFYRPTEGEILLNGIPVSDFGREEYYALIAVLFQDSALLPMTLDFNLTGESPEHIDYNRLEKALLLSGFHEKYHSLPRKGETLLTDFSGGEKQKLLFAKTLYKDTPLMILDEPAAALDPIAENEMYLKFDEAAKGRTCLYISHRLSSTRFCDRILLMEDGAIMEEGTHEELIARDGRYARLFEVQSKYYKEQEERRRKSALMEQ